MATPSVHTYRIQTRWSDFDMYGHMMNANYIELAQEARLAFAKEHIYSKGLDFIAFVRHLDVDFLRPMEFKDTTTVEVETTISQIGTTSFTTTQQVKDDQGEVAATVECVQLSLIHI